MIQAKFKIKDKWEYRDFNSKEELDKFIQDNKAAFSEYKIREETKKNWFLNWWSNIRNTKKNWKKVKASPFASLSLSYKFRKIIVGLLIPYLLWMTYKMIRDSHVIGAMGIVSRVVTIGVMAWIMYKIYSTIPAAKKQIEYYKKYPHLVDYCPANVKETVDGIINKIKENQEKEKEVNKDVR